MKDPTDHRTYLTEHTERCWFGDCDLCPANRLVTSLMHAHCGCDCHTNRNAR
jgi:hypothetical protein